ncbi:Lsm6 [Columba livia]|nr:Lsm6 [Columba livia]
MVNASIHPGTDTRLSSTCPYICKAPIQKQLHMSLPEKIKMSLRKQTPSDFLKQIIGRPVVVKLNSGVDYRGVLACLDGYMNIALEQTEEYVNGQLKNNIVHKHTEEEDVKTTEGVCFVLVNLIEVMSPI